MSDNMICSKFLELFRKYDETAKKRINMRGLVLQSKERFCKR